MAHRDAEARKEYMRRYYVAHRVLKIGRAKAKYSTNKERVKAWYVQLRRDALQQYGNSQCSCCGERTEEFLAIDHVHGGGNKHRNSVTGRGSNFYRWLKKNEYPDGFRVLCHNCNLAKGFYGECPHKKQVRVVIRRGLMKVV